MKDNLLESENLVIKKNKNQILTLSKFSIKECERLGLIGVNGAGKTTAMLALSGLMKFKCGSIKFRGGLVGRDISYIHYRRNISVVFQNSILINDTVFNNIALGLRFRGLNNKCIDEKVNQVLDALKITHLALRKPTYLSGGEAQRVSIARALVVDPKILFLDEAFSTIDASYKESLISDLSELLKKNNITLIMTSHDKSELFRLCDRVVQLDKGEIVFDGSKDDLIKSPKNDFAASFVGIETIIQAKVEHCKDGIYSATVANKKIEGFGEFSAGESIMIYIRPENVFLSKTNSALESSVRNNFEGVVTEITNFGHFYRVTIDCGFKLVSYITKTSFDQLAISKNMRINAGFKAVGIHSTKIA